MELSNRVFLLAATRCWYAATEAGASVAVSVGGSGAVCSSSVCLEGMELSFDLRALPVLLRSACFPDFPQVNLSDHLFFAVREGTAASWRQTPATFASIFPARFAS